MARQLNDLEMKVYRLATTEKSSYVLLAAAFLRLYIHETPDVERNKILHDSMMLAKSLF